jgi:hypothetical protein
MSAYEVTMLYPLAPSFATSWRNLPIDLKLDILSCILVQDTVLNVFWLNEHSRRRYRSDTDRPVGTRNFWFFLEYAEFGDLAFDVFFKQNVFSVTTDLVHIPRSYPEPYITDCIQSIEIHMTCIPADCIWFTDFVRGDFGYRNLRSVVLCIDSPRADANDFDLFVDLIVASGPLVLAVESLGIRFRCFDCRDEMKGIDASAFKELIRAQVMRRRDIVLPLMSI